MVGGTQAAFERARPISRAWDVPDRITQASANQGRSDLQGTGNQMAIGGALAAVGEAFCRRAGCARRSGARASGAARRVCGEPRARSARRAAADVQLVPGFRAALIKDLRIARVAGALGVTTRGQRS
jgi:3-hydroxyisobutyrate dehydrogenase-like beta-hydroxyacid dehydrogenase